MHVLGGAYMNLDQRGAARRARHGSWTRRCACIEQRQTAGNSTVGCLQHGRRQEGAGWAHRYPQARRAGGLHVTGVQLQMLCKGAERHRKIGLVCATQRNQWLVVFMKGVGLGRASEGIGRGWRSRHGGRHGLRACSATQPGPAPCSRLAGDRCKVHLTPWGLGKACRAFTAGLRSGHGLPRVGGGVGGGPAPLGCALRR